jgi:FKBP-type peptidyl-prolyl cis-trans isomerase FkpA
MTEITRVPLQPIAAGALGKLWLGIVLAIALGGAVAFETRQKGLEFETIKAGSGPSPTTADLVRVNIVGRLANGKLFAKEDDLAMSVQETLPGFSVALQKMQKGGKYHVVIPARLAYGAVEKRDPQTGEVAIPANSDLTFDIELVDFKSAAEVMRQRMLMQQLQRQMQGAGGAPGTPGAAPGGAEAGPPPQ